MEVVVIKKFKAFFNFLLLLLLGVFLTSCGSKGVVMSPIVFVEGEEIGIVGYVANETDKEHNDLPSVYKEVEHQKVNPNAKVKLDYEDEPKKVVLKQWRDGVYSTEKALAENSFNAPNEEGIYTYNIATRWNYKTASNTVFVLAVEE